MLKHSAKYSSLWENIKVKLQKDNVWSEAWSAACDVAWDNMINNHTEQRQAAWNELRYAGILASWDTQLALVSFDNCAHLLYSDPKEVELLAKLGVTAAVLILPACIAISSIKDRSG